MKQNTSILSNIEIFEMSEENKRLKSNKMKLLEENRRLKNELIKIKNSLLSLKENGNSQS